MNTPVEDQESLLELIGQVYGESGIEVPKLKRALELSGGASLAKNMNKKYQKGVGGAGQLQNTPQRSKRFVLLSPRLPF